MTGAIVDQAYAGACMHQRIEFLANTTSCTHAEGVMKRIPSSESRVWETSMRHTKGVLLRKPYRHTHTHTACIHHPPSFHLLSCCCRCCCFDCCTDAAASLELPILAASSLNRMQRRVAEAGSTPSIQHRLEKTASFSSGSPLALLLLLLISCCSLTSKNHSSSSKAEYTDSNLVEVPFEEGS